MARIRPRIMVVRLLMDQNWKAEAFQRLGLKHQWDYYIYDETRQTNCCELEPSYLLTYFGFDFETVAEVDGCTREMIHDEIDAEQINNEPEIYMHVRRVEAIPMGASRKPVYVPDTIPETEAEYAEMFAAVFEHVRCNTPF